MNRFARIAVASALAVAAGGVLLTLAGAYVLRNRIAAGRVPGSPVVASARERDDARAQGRAVAEMLRKGETAALFRRFTPRMAQAVPEAMLKQVADSLTKQAPIGERLGESVRDMGGARVYAAEHQWAGGQNLRVTVTFEGADGRIGGLLAQPAKPLPPDPHAGYRTKTKLRLPFAAGEEWYVFWGGDTEMQNYHVVAPDQRHAYDIVARFPDGGGTRKGDGARNEDYAAWGRQIVAPADATVLEAVDGVRDNQPQKETNRQEIAGNHVVLDFGNGEYALLAHLQSGSVLVKAGDKVKAGQPLGKCGNSGNTSEPHLHFHLQDKPGLFNGARGLPVAFTDYVSDGKPVAAGTPVQGETIRAK